MIRIAKRAEPSRLTGYRLQPDAVFDGPNFTPVKDAIRGQLLQEQGHLCAYCMSRIRPENMKVEHWRSRKTHPEDQLSFWNLLGVCKGNEGQLYSHQHCDTRKGDHPLSYNPASPADRVEERIWYLGDGKIGSDDAHFDKELNATLNLNLRRMSENRKSIIDAVTNGLGGKPGSCTKVEIERMCERWCQRTATGELPEYLGVARYLLNKRLHRFV